MIGPRSYKVSKANTLLETSEVLVLPHRLNNLVCQKRVQLLNKSQHCSHLNSPNAWRGTQLAVLDIKFFKTLVTEVTLTTLRYNKTGINVGHRVTGKSTCRYRSVNFKIMGCGDNRAMWRKYQSCVFLNDKSVSLLRHCYVKFSPLIWFSNKAKAEN